MREYLFNILGNLDKLCGLKQIQKIYEAHNSKEEAKVEINELLDVLCRVCNQFDYIPDQNKQDIINRNVLSDQEFIGLNGRILFKWFSKECGAYYKDPVEEIKLPAGIEKYEPLTGEARQQKIDEWKKSLNAFQESVKPDFSGTRMKANLNELPVLESYQSLSADELNAKELHIRYLRENYDPMVVGKKKECWVPEIEWIKQNKTLKNYGANS